jgi:hypothetical protein
LNLLKEYKLRSFTSEELEFLAEYERVMTPLAAKLDILQGDKQSYLGCLLPHIIHLESQLTNLLNGTRRCLTYTRELVQIMLTKLCASDRFGPMLENDDYRMASCFHPAYKLNWIRMWNPSKLTEIRERMTIMVADEIRAQDPEKQRSHPVTAERRRKEGAAADSEIASTSNGIRRVPVYNDDDDDEVYKDLTTLFNSYQQEVARIEAPQKTYTEMAKELVNMWESSPATKQLDDAAFMDSPVFMELFRKTNTGVVSSAACERFFSQGKDFLKPKRENMSAGNFEALMFMRGNAHLWAVPKAQKRREVAKRRPHPTLEFLANEKC